MRAAAYARFSSDAQREESIEIQVEQIRSLADRMGWDVVEVYADYAVSGTREDRPSFNRCLADAEAGAFDVLAVYKMDRFARNVAFAQEAKRRLFAAGVRLWSVREGEVSDTPEGFLMGGMSDLFAEYYSRNLSVMVKNGIRKSASDLKAAGRRTFGYRVGDGDRYEVDEAQGAAVRRMFEMYAAGSSANEIASSLNGEGILTLRGKLWTPPSVMRVLSNETYRGVYSYVGVRVEGGVPAIVDDALFARVQEIRERRKRSKRRKIVNDYLLTEKVFCLRCGKPMCGTAGTSKTGKKYTYYGCVHKGGCGLRVSSSLVESKVAEVLATTLSDPATIDAIAADMVAFSEEASDSVALVEQELAEARRRRDRLVAAIMDGVPASTVAEALSGCERTVCELEGTLAQRRAELDQCVDFDAARSFLTRTFAEAGSDDETAKLLYETFVERVYADKENVVIVLALGDEKEYGIEEIGAVLRNEDAGIPARAFPLDQGNKKCEPAGVQRVRMCNAWWAMRDLNPRP